MFPGPDEVDSYGFGEDPSEVFGSLFGDASVVLVVSGLVDAGDDPSVCEEFFFAGEAVDVSDFAEDE